jgi:hypothetical protein
MPPRIFLVALPVVAQAQTPVGAVTRRERDLAGNLGTKRWCP